MSDIVDVENPNDEFVRLYDQGYPDTKRMLELLQHPNFDFEHYNDDGDDVLVILILNDYYYEDELLQNALPIVRKHIRHINDRTFRHALKYSSSGSFKLIYDTYQLSPNYIKNLNPILIVCTSGDIFSDTFERKKSIIDFLISKGFSFEPVIKELEKIGESRYDYNREIQLLKDNIIPETKGVMIEDL